MAASPQLRGFLRLYLGAAAGVGKTYQMLGDARLAADEGADLVIGYLEPHGRVATEERARGLERAPLLRFGAGGRAETEIDVDWLIERRPSVAIVDELAHTNAAGSVRHKRYEDVGVLLDHGIDVWTTVNIQHLESLNSRIRTLTGVEVRETFPDRLLHEADEIKLVDLSPASLRERIARGLVYPPNGAMPRSRASSPSRISRRCVHLFCMSSRRSPRPSCRSRRPAPGPPSACSSPRAPAVTPTRTSSASGLAWPAAATRSSTCSASSRRTGASVPTPPA